MSFVSGLKERMNQVITKANSLVADESVHKERISICNSCEFLSITRNCKKCGCFVDVKSKFAEQHCPIRKW